MSPSTTKRRDSATTSPLPTIPEYDTPLPHPQVTMRRRRTTLDLETEFDEHLVHLARETEKVLGRLRAYGEQGVKWWEEGEEEEEEDSSRAAAASKPMTPEQPAEARALPRPASVVWWSDPALQPPLQQRKVGDWQHRQRIAARCQEAVTEMQAYALAASQGMAGDGEKEGRMQRCLGWYDGEERRRGEVERRRREVVAEEAAAAGRVRWWRRLGAVCCLRARRG